MVAYTTRMPSGIPGDVTRPASVHIEPAVLNSALPFAAYGVFGKIASGRFVPVTTGDAASAVYGLLVRPFPITGANASDPLGTAVPPTTGMADVLRRGYASVLLRAGTAAQNGQVHVRVAAASAGRPIGGIEAAADGSNTIAVAGCTFMGPADASGNVEIAYNI